MLFVYGNCRYAWLQTLGLKQSMLIELQILSGTLFPTATAQCLKPCAARTVSVTLTVKRHFACILSVRGGDQCLLGDSITEVK